VYGLARADGVQVLVMEVVEGPTFAGHRAGPIASRCPFAKQTDERSKRRTTTRSCTATLN
jgi:hypothetical protein